MAAFLVAAALAAAAPAAVPASRIAPSNDDPAIFVVRDADTTVYLFGTFHALDGQSEWFNDQVRDAFEKSNELVLETLVPETPGPVVMRQPARMPSVTASASFLATTRMAINAGKTKGMQVNNGADMVLRHEAELEGKSVEGLETLESQLNMFSRMPASLAAPAPQPGTAVGPS